MVNLMTDKDSRTKRKEARAKLSELEADAAYFEARLEMLDEEVSTSYQSAQEKIFSALRKSTMISLEDLESLPDPKKQVKK
jgi:hypothetical protein